MKSHPEGGEGKCLPAGYKVSSRALNSGELRRCRALPASPAVHTSAAAEEAKGRILHPAMRPVKGFGSDAGEMGFLLDKQERGTFPRPKTDPH